MDSTGLRPFEDAVDEVVSADILRLVELYDDDRAALADRGLVGTTLAHRAGEEATALAKMIAALPPGEQMRCHMPRYGVVFGLGSGDSLSVAICFRCNNARTFEGRVEGWFTFDGGSTAAVRLLTLLRTMDPGSAHTS